MPRYLLPSIGFFVFGSALGGCSAAPSADPASTDERVPDETRSQSSALLVGGVRETLVDGITGAENCTFTASGRFFATGDGGIYEITRDAGGQVSATPASAPSGCRFAGIAEVKGVLYVNCYDGTNSKIVAATLAPAPAFRAIHDLPGVALANGAAADANGKLYVADSTHGTIWRFAIDPANPFSLTAKDAFSTGNLFPNGLKYFDGSIYFTDFVAVRRIDLLAGGSPGPAVTLTSQLTFFDDLYVDAKGILVANYLFGYLEGLTPSGLDVLDTAALGLNGPSAVLPAKGRFGLAQDDVIVTERSANRIAVFHPR